MALKLLKLFSCYNLRATRLTLTTTSFKISHLSIYILISVHFIRFILTSSHFIHFILTSIHFILSYSQTYIYPFHTYILTSTRFILADSHLSVSYLQLFVRQFRGSAIYSWRIHANINLIVVNHNQIRFGSLHLRLWTGIKLMRFYL